MGLTPDEVVARVRALVPDATVPPAETTRGQAVVVVAREQAAEALRVLRADRTLDLDQLSDVTCVDYLGRTPRFEVVYQLRSLAKTHRLRVKVPVPAEDPTVPSAVPLWPSANWAEREVWDLFGIRFTGHPDLRRILMYESFEGHPLRKDYPVNRRQPLVPERDPLQQPWSPRPRGT
ncbi:MAG: NADH-quinone oxidoreductase subunit C [Candidatus Binatia bacterium]